DRFGQKPWVAADVGNGLTTLYDASGRSLTIARHSKPVGLIPVSEARRVPVAALTWLQPSSRLMRGTAYTCWRTRRPRGAGRPRAASSRRPCSSRAGPSDDGGGEP